MPDEDDEFEEVELDELEDAEGQMTLESLRPGDPDYLVVTGRTDPDVDDMLEGAFANAIRVSIPAPSTIPAARAPPDVDAQPERDEDLPTDRPPAPIEDPDDVEFHAFMKNVGKLKLPDV